MFCGYHFPLICLLWIVVVAKFSDVGGLLVGLRFGKHKISLNFSPKKTWEGLLGSIIFSTVAGYVFRIILRSQWPSEFSWLKVTLVATIIAIVALLSDLTESGFKRLANSKDSGRVFPGIGGALDLIDSLIFSLPVGILLIQWVV